MVTTSLYPMSWEANHWTTWVAVRKGGGTRPVVNLSASCYIWWWVLIVAAHWLDEEVDIVSHSPLFGVDVQEYIYSNARLPYQLFANARNQAKPSQTFGIYNVWLSLRRLGFRNFSLCCLRARQAPSIPHVCDGSIPDLFTKRLLATHAAFFCFNTSLHVVAEETTWRVELIQTDSFDCVL